jgi:hypothetical protein
MCCTVLGSYRDGVFKQFITFPDSETQHILMVWLYILPGTCGIFCTDQKRIAASPQNSETLHINFFNFGVIHNN